MSIICTGCKKCQPDEWKYYRINEVEELRAQAIKFADWLDSLSPSERVSVWSKDGSGKGLFSMDNEQLLEKFKRIKPEGGKG